MKIFVLNLDESKDRWVHVVEQSKQQGFEPIRVSAFPAKTSSIRHVNSKFSLGMIGCFISHERLWEEAVRNNYEPFIILEDDVTFTCRNLEVTVSEVMKDLPKDWDIAFLGWEGVSRNISVSQNWQKSVSGHTWGTHAYLINGKKGAKSLQSIAHPFYDQTDLQTILEARKGNVNAYFLRNKIAFQNGKTPTTVQYGGGVLQQRVVTQPQNEVPPSIIKSKRQQSIDAQHIVLHYDHIAHFGGIESFMYNLSQLFYENGYRVSITYNSQKSSNIYKYADYADVIDITKHTVECDVSILSANDLIPKKLKSQKTIKVFHSDYEKYGIGITKEDNVTYVAAAHANAKVANKLFGVDVTVINNLAEKRFYEELPLVFITNSRISKEKGFERMLIMCDELHNANRKFIWHVYGDNVYCADYVAEIKQLFSRFPEVKFMGHKEDILIETMSADYLVQLSDFEGYCIAIEEAKSLGTPVITTNYSSAEEIINDNGNVYGIILDMNLSNFDANTLKKKHTICRNKRQEVLNKWISLFKS